MHAVGIVAEYNPFHRGHFFNLERARELSGADAAVIAMSGDFVQRGEAAVFSKFARAEAAVRAGADLVLELPLPWSIASAEGFARGGAGLLAASGVTDAVCFGSECGDIAGLSAAAEALELPETEEHLRDYLRSGISYAAARQKAVADTAGEACSALLSSPNNTLGIEYLRALQKLEYTGRVLTVRREGSEHDGAGSASELRELLYKDEDIRSLTPPECLPVWERESAEGRMITPEALETALLSRLRMLREEDYARLPDAAEGLEHRLYEAARTGESMEAVLSAAKTKRYARSRLRRMLLCAALGVEKGISEGLPPYIRPLAANETGLRLLGEMKAKASLPIISRAGELRSLGGMAEKTFELTARAHDFYVLGYRNSTDRRSDEDFRKSFFIYIEK